MTRTSLIPILTLSLLGTTATAQSLRAGWLLCTRDLELRETLIDHADERELILRSAYGIRSSIPMSEVLFLIRNDAQPEGSEFVGAPAPELSPVRMISYIDGQVIRGSISEHDRPEELAFNLIAGRSMHGEARVPLELILRIGDNGQSGVVDPSEALPDDTLVTRTGDTIVGFVESIGPTTRVALGQDGELEIETARVETIRMANDPEPVAGVYLTFNDHEVLRAGNFDFDTSQPISIGVDGASLGLLDTGNSLWEFDADSIRSLSVRGSGAQIIGLNQLTPERVEPTGDRDWVPAPSVLESELDHPSMGSIDLPTPMRVRYAIPDGTRRFACTLEASVEQWTDCVARVIAQTARGPKVLFEERLNADSSTASVNVLIPRGSSGLIIEIDPGEHGPIQDRVLLHRPRLLIEG